MSSTDRHTRTRLLRMRRAATTRTKVVSAVFWTKLRAFLRRAHFLVSELAISGTTTRPQKDHFQEQYH